MPDDVSAQVKQKKASTSAQQMEGLQQPLLSSQQYLQQQQHVEEVTIDTNGMIQDHRDDVLLPDCCRVPITIRCLKEKAYTPRVVSIGPFHHGEGRLKDMERHKQILFERFTQRTKSSQDDLVSLVKDLEQKVHASYSETNKPELVELLLDAGFIIELFIMYHEINEKKEGGNNDAELRQPWLANSIKLDLLLLENQLPFFFIEQLFNRALPNSGLPSFRSLTYEYFKDHNGQKLEPHPKDKIKHFTDLLRLFYLREDMPKRHPPPEDGNHILSYNANALQEAGINLKYCTSKCLLDVDFSGHTLTIPQIVVDDYTELLFRNMIALEQCRYPDAAYITDYALLLDRLIDTNKDVDILVHQEIVKNYLGDTNNVASLFNGLLDNVVRSTFNPEFSNICDRLNKYCRKDWNLWKAYLRHDYCSTPWQTVATIAGIVLLILTVVQTIFVILQVVE